MQRSCALLTGHWSSVIRRSAGLLAIGASTILLLCQTLPAGDWTGFRGPGGAGTSDEKDLPVRWSADENIVWRTELPGPGTSSPTVVGARVYLTCYTGYGEDEANIGDQDDLMRHVVCVDRNTGRIAWTKSFEPELPESRYEGNGARHGYSSSTIASDGERLYVFFGRSGVYCLDLAGNELWHASVGERTNGWGSSNSPVLFENLVIINASVESNALVALDKQSGEEVWRAGGIRSCWSTPILVEVPGGQTELVVSAKGLIAGYDPRTGEELWRADGIDDYICPSPVSHEGIVYAMAGRSNATVAVRAGGRGDVTDSHVLWRTNKGSKVPSPVYHEGHLYWVHDGRGVAYCLDAATGDVVYEQRLDPRPGVVYSSIVLADGKLYAVSQHDGTFVIAAKPEFELLAHNTFEGDDSRANASPVPSRGQLLLRNDAYLYCIGK
jgi:outer membrane protein assembly factor BamB